MGINYYDPWLFDRAEAALGIDNYVQNPATLYTNLPTTTYSEYKDAVAAAYSSAPPLYQTLINFHLSALTEVVSSGVTTDPDYWSAGTVDGNYIINSGITHAKVGINTIVPNHELSVSGSVSASSSLYGSTLYSGSTDLADILITLSADTGTVTSVAISGSDGIDVDSGSPITDSGTIALGLSNVDATKIADGTVTDTEFQYINTLSSNAQNQLTGKLDLAGGTMEGVIAMNELKITGLGDPTDAQDAATKAYADSLDHSSYWSAGTVDGNYIINSGITHAKVGINTIVPNHELSVSGTVSASSSLYASTLYSGTTDISTLIAAAGAGGGSTDVYWSAGTVDGNYIINSGITHAKVGINTIVPNHELSVSGSVSASTSIFVGSDCIFKSPESGSVFIGDDAGASWEDGSTSNTAVGRLAMGFATMSNAVQNTAIGFASIANITTGTRNTALGLQSNTSNSTGSWNTTVGVTAMFGNTYHSYNTAVGANTMYFTTSGSLGKTVPTDTHNTAIGYSSQYYNLNGAYNTSVGSQAIGNSTIAYAGTGSTAMGFKALFGNTTGSYNAALGYQAGDSITTGDYNICIGYDSDVASATGDYQLNIGDTILGKDLVGDNLSINAVGIGTAVTPSLLTHTLTVSGDTLINGDLDCSGTLIVTGKTTMANTLSATTSVKVGNGDGLVSAATITASGAIVATSLEGTLATAAQGNVTSLGTLSTLSITQVEQETNALTITGIEENLTDLVLVQNSGGDAAFKVNSDNQVVIAALESTPIGATTPSSGKFTTLNSTGTLIVTGNTTLNGTLSATTSLNVGNGDGTISANTVNGAYQFISFLGNCGSIANDYWKGPGSNGISNHSWSENWDNVDGLVTGDTVLSLGRTEQHAYIRVPAGTRLIGLEGAVRSSTNDDVYAGLFTFLPDYEGPSAAEATLRILAQTPSSSNVVTNDPQSWRLYAAEGDQHVFAEGECIIPAIRRGSSSSQSIIGSLTIILKY